MLNHMGSPEIFWGYKQFFFFTNFEVYLCENYLLNFGGYTQDHACLIIALLKKTRHVIDTMSFKYSLKYWMNDLVGFSNLDNVTRSMWNESYFPLETACYLNGCFIALNFTEWLKLFHRISLKANIKMAELKWRIEKDWIFLVKINKQTSLTNHLRSSHSAIPSPVCASGTSMKPPPASESRVMASFENQLLLPPPPSHHFINWTKSR